MFSNVRKGIEIGFGFILVLLLSGMTYAVFNSLSHVNSGESLTKSIWDKMVDNQNDLNSRIDVLSGSIASTQNNLINNLSFVRIQAIATIGSSDSGNWYGTASCPSGYSIINWGAEGSIQYWAEGLTHRYGYCNKLDNGIQARLYTDKGKLGHDYKCFGLCLKD